MQTGQRYNALAFRGGVVADESLDAVVVSRALNMAALTLVNAYTAKWVLPLFSEHLEFAGGQRGVHHGCAIAFGSARAHAEHGVSGSCGPIPCDVQQTTDQMDRGPGRRRSLRNVGARAGIWLCPQITTKP